MGLFSRGVTEQQVLAALSTVQEPELGGDLVSRKMIKDHVLAEKKLQTAAKGSGATVAMSLDDPHQAMVTALESKSGADFDKAYVADQVQAHQETAALLSDYKASGDDAKLKTWATKTLPAVNMHLKMAQAMPAM